MGLLKLIGIFFLVWVVYRIVRRLFFSLFMSKFINPNVGQGRQQQRRREGEVTINYSPRQTKKIHKEEGDYVEFEEIKK